MARTRTTKKLAQRIDLNYFKRPTPLKRAKLWLSVLLSLLALAWIAWRGFSGDHRVYSSGRMSKAHAVLETDCSVCHLQTAAAFSAKAADSACLGCHDGPLHHATQTETPACATCHVEHRGRISIATASSQACAECHADLRLSKGAAAYETHIRSLEKGHPEFAALRLDGINGGRDLAAIKLNHALHLKPIRSGPTGPTVQLECGNCHRPAAVDADLTYADPRYRAATVSYGESDEVMPMRSGALRPPRPMTGRELMAPVKFANACASCHLLTFDKRFDEGVPHDNPEVVLVFVVKKFQQYIAAHPAEVRVTRNPNRDLTGKPLPPQVRVLSPAQWVAERTAEAEQLLWRKTCKQCHTLYFGQENQSVKIPQSASPRDDASSHAAPTAALPEVAHANVTLQWMPHAKFDHDAHRGFTCAGCHAKALTSTESSDVLLPGIETCRTCHAPGPDNAESRCFECHTYHDWSKRKEVTPKFTLPALQTGRGRQ